MTRTNRLFIALAAAAATTATVAFPAYAAEMTSKTTQVRYGDLNLASADGAQALKVRVERAAKRVCSVEGDRSLEAAAVEHKCSKVAIARAMPQVELALANAGTQVADAGRMTVAAAH